ncbi:DUF2917 domain-containing protein [Propionivibrio sp.]|uniref:DUF2917 domain-containing protein n=1 Tax=Propionivibrio sp. TaxID=2212460 RepID=UPI0025FF58AC|nr:DUF2917 domain-containing protein [Propionivibrio sp.]MBK8400143.1 DUF2917 domain-containing protein [Propionivibrio sp.]MBK8744616.1 DUF2917 domain-containing protein [Propionivibrio sp.]MBK8893833.1 DUF2917 domain-containing protein [Propionivibrio sp.]MBL0207960.1 DUF2917 domain-containing protein [Propionivibrio sp.]
MTSITQETPYPLAKRELLALDRASGNRLQCASGELWITREGRQEDIILKPGESWRVDVDAAVIVSALCPSVLVVAHPPATKPRIAPRQLVESILLLVRRWQHRPLSSYPSTLLR